MQEVYKSNNLEIYRNIQVGKELIKICEEGVNKNLEIFKKQPKKIRIFVCDTEEDFKKYSKYYYFPHGAGTCLRNGDVIVRSNDFLTRKEKDYSNLMVHEVNHSFWAQFYGMSKPIWLMEALAMTVEGRWQREGVFFDLKKTKILIKEKNWNFACIKYRYLERDFNSREKIALFYSIWGHFAEFISNKNPSQLAKFMSDYKKNPTKENYESLFVKHFGDTLKNKFNEFIK